MLLCGKFVAYLQRKAIKNACVPTNLKSQSKTNICTCASHNNLSITFKKYFYLNALKSSFTLYSFVCTYIYICIYVYGDSKMLSLILKSAQKPACQRKFCLQK